MSIFVIKTHNIHFINNIKVVKQVFHTTNLSFLTIIDNKKKCIYVNCIII